VIAFPPERIDMHTTDRRRRSKLRHYKRRTRSVFVARS